MTEQIHKRLVDEQVETILDRYLNKEISSEQGMDLLGLKRRQFFRWVKRYRQSTGGFTVDYKRVSVNRRIGTEVEDRIFKELAAEKRLIDDKAMPVWFYNYSYIQDQLRKQYNQEVSLPTIISRAKKTVFTFRNERKEFMTMRYQPIMLGS